MYRIAICIKIWLEPDSTRYQTDCSFGTGIGYLNTCRIAIFFSVWMASYCRIKDTI